LGALWIPQGTAKSGQEVILHTSGFARIWGGTLPDLELGVVNPEARNQDPAWCQKSRYVQYSARE
jgi:hypothetical protein